MVNAPHIKTLLQRLQSGEITQAQYDAETASNKDSGKDKVIDATLRRIEKFSAPEKNNDDKVVKSPKTTNVDVKNKSSLPEAKPEEKHEDAPKSGGITLNNTNNKPATFSFSSARESSESLSFSSLKSSLSSIGSSIYENVKSGLSFKGPNNIFNKGLEIARNVINSVSSNETVSAISKKLGMALNNQGEASMHGFGSHEAWCANYYTKKNNMALEAKYGPDAPKIKETASVAVLIDDFKSHGAYKAIGSAANSGTFKQGDAFFFNRHGGHHVAEVEGVMQKDGKLYVQLNQGNFGNKVVSDAENHRWREITRVGNTYHIHGMNNLPLIGVGNLDDYTSDKGAGKVRHASNINKHEAKEMGQHIANTDYDMDKAPSKPSGSKHTVRHS